MTGTLDEGLAKVNAKRAGAQEALDAGGRARAVAFLARPRCVVCGGPMLVTGRDRHFLCDPTTAVGKSCTCPPGCSGKRYGDGPRLCAGDCVPCRLNAGRLCTERDSK